MRILAFLMSLCLIASCSTLKNQSSDIQEQRKIYKSWVVSRCIAAISSTEDQKQDAFNSASAYLEISRLPVESFSNADPLINEFVAKDYQGSIPGSFNTKQCVDLFFSDELEEIFLKEYKAIH